jgi:hypothetical protein
MAEIAFDCPQCGHAYPFAPRLAGKCGRCKACRAVFRIPEDPSAVTKGVAVALPPTPATSLSSRPADDATIAFNCPICGHGYRLDAKLVGTPARCTSCRGIFTVPPPAGPAPARPQPVAPRSAPVAPRGFAARPPATVTAAAGDSGGWELDLSESIPAATARGGADRRPTATAVTSPPPILDAEVRDDQDDAPVVTARPGGTGRPRWALYATIGAGVVAGAVAFGVTFLLVSGAVKPTPPAVADSPAERPTPTNPPAVVAEPATPKPTPRPTPPRDPLAEQHRQAIEAVVRAYNEIADGYVRIRDGGSIADGNAAVARGVADLRSASERGKSLPPLSPGRRQVLAGQAGPALLRAVDRVLGELRRLRATPGLRSDFDRLIDAYTRTREAIRHQIDPF